MRKYKINQVSLNLRTTSCAALILFLFLKSNQSTATGITWFEEYTRPYSASTSISGGEATWQVFYTPLVTVGDLVGGLKGREIEVKGSVFSTGSFATSTDSESITTTTGQAIFGSFNEPTVTYGPVSRVTIIDCFSKGECEKPIAADFDFEDPYSSITYTSLTKLTQADKFGVITGKLNVVSDFGAAKISGTVRTSGTARVSYEYNLWAPSAETQKTFNGVSDALRATSYAVGLFGTSVDLATISSPKNLKDEILLLNTLRNGASTGASIFKDPLAAPVFSNDFAESIADESTNFLIGTISPETYTNPAAAASQIASGISLLSLLGAVSASYIASDPPDPNYKVLLTDSTSDIYQMDQFTSEAGKSVGIVNNKLFQFAESVRLATSSLERYQGAMLANDFEYATLQLNNFKAFEAQYKSLMSQLPQDIQNAKGELGSLGLLSINPDFAKLTSLIRELQTNPETLESFKEFLAIYSPGTTIDEIVLASLNADELVSPLAQEYEFKTFGGEFDNLSNTFIALNDGYSDIANIPAVPEPSTYLMMLVGLALIMFKQRGEKLNKTNCLGVFPTGNSWFSTRS